MVVTSKLAFKCQNSSFEIKIGQNFGCNVKICPTLGLGQNFGFLRSKLWLLKVKIPVFISKLIEIGQNFGFLKVKIGQNFGCKIKICQNCRLRSKLWVSKIETLAFKVKILVLRPKLIKISQNIGILHHFFCSRFNSKE